MLSKQLLENILKEKYTLDEKTIAELTAKAAKMRKTLEQYVVDENTVDEGELYAAAAKKMNVPSSFLGEIGEHLMQTESSKGGTIRKVIYFD